MLMQRIMGVFRLDRQVFAEIEHDESATSQAVIVVAIVAVSAVIGNIFGVLFSLIGGGGQAMGGLILSLVGAFVLAFVNWAVWSVITFFVGTKLFNGQADLGEMLRVIGFASAPRILQIIPCIGGIVGGIWALVASYFAIKEGLDLDDGSTIATVVVGWLVTLALQAILGAIGLGGALGAAGIFSLLGR
jgi:hypothetical protein